MGHDKCKDQPLLPMRANLAQPSILPGVVARGPNSNAQIKCSHPNGLKERFRNAIDIDEAMGVLLEASHEERKVRARIRRAATLDEALESLLEFENFGEDESEGELNFHDFDDCQLFVMSDGESEGCETPEFKAAAKAKATEAASRSTAKRGWQSEQE